MQNPDLNQSAGNASVSPPAPEPSTTPAGATRDIIIALNNTNNLPVRDTTVEVRDNTTTIYLYTNDSGFAAFQGTQNKTYKFLINAESYDSVDTNITVLSTTSDPIRFTLKPQNGSDFWPLFIPAIAGFIVFISWYLRFYYNRIFGSRLLSQAVTTLCLFIQIASWPAVIIAMILYYHKDYVTLPGILTPGPVSFTIYIPVVALVGIIAYLYRSMEETFTQVLPDHKKKSIIWGYLRRITIAPYIAILGVYILLDAANVQNTWFVYGFSFFAGVFTKTIEEWLYKAIQKLLPEDLRKQIDERVNYNIENSDFVIRLDMDEDIAYKLSDAGIRTIDQLAAVDDAATLYEKVKSISKSKKDPPYPLSYLDGMIVKAREIAAKDMQDLNKLKKELKLKDTVLHWMVKNKVHSIDDLATFNVDDPKIEYPIKLNDRETLSKDELKKLQTQAKEILASEKAPSAGAAPQAPAKPDTGSKAPDQLDSQSEKKPLELAPEIKK